MKVSNLFKITGAITLVAFLSLVFRGAEFAGAAGPPATLRQEVNITDAYLYAGSGSYATSSEIANIDPSKYSGTVSYYFEVEASTTSATTASVALVNSVGTTITSVSVTGGNTYQLYRSSSFTPTAAATDYKVRLNNEAIGKGIKASRVIIIQSIAGTANSDATSTETQIEIGSATISASNVSTLSLQNPKYWSYNSSKWDGSPTFSAEVTYNTSELAASSTIYNVNGTYTYTVSSTTKYAVVEAWGAGGGGAITTTTGGGGGGGGAYARSTTTPTVGATHTLVVGKGGTADNGTPATKSTYDSTTVVADFGLSATVGSGVAGGTVANSTGDVKFKGGTGGSGVTTNDTNGGGGGAGGPDGAGEDGAVAQTSLNGAGGRGDNTLGGTAGTAATFGAGTTGGNGGPSALGGGGGGGSGNNNSGASGSNGGLPGGGGGGEDGGTVSPTGADGQIKLTEWGGYVGIALEEDNGNFGSWTFNKMVVTQGTATTTPTRVRVSFTPTNGKHYRLTASTTQSALTYSIYNAKIVVDQGIGINDFYSESNQDTTLGECVTPTCFNQAQGQSFTSAGGTLTSAKFYLSKTGSPTGNITAVLYAHSGTFGSTGIPTGAALATSDVVDITTLSTSLALVTFTFSGVNQYSMVGGTNYFIVVDFASGGSTLNVGYDSLSPTHVGNYASEHIGTWTANNSDDLVFYVYSGSLPTLLEPQYTLAPYPLSSGTSLQQTLAKFDTTEWSGTANTYLLDVDSANSSASVVTTSDTPLTTTYATVSSPSNEATSTFTCIPSSSATVDSTATTNNNDIYSVRWLVDVSIGGAGGTSACTSGGAPVTIPKLNLPQATLTLQNGKLSI